MAPTGDARTLSDQLMELARAPEIATAADAILVSCRAVDLVSDWDACAEKTNDFTRLCVAAGRLLPAGGFATQLLREFTRTAWLEAR